QLFHLGRRVAPGQTQGAFTDDLKVLTVLADRDEPGLLPGEAREVPQAEVAASVGTATDVVDAGAAHQGVVDIEEGDNRLCCGDVAGRQRAHATGLSAATLEG